MIRRRPPITTCVQPQRQRREVATWERYLNEMQREIDENEKAGLLYRARCDLRNRYAVMLARAREGLPTV